MAFLFPEGRGISDLWSEKSERIERAYEATLAKDAFRCASRGKTRTSWQSTKTVDYTFPPTPYVRSKNIAGKCVVILAGGLPRLRQTKSRF